MTRIGAMISLGCPLIRVIRASAANSSYCGRSRWAKPLEAFRFRHPVRVGAQLAVFTHEHLSGFLVSLQLPPRPVRSDISPLAAAGMIDSRRVACALPRTVERGQLLDRLVGCLRRRHQEVALVAVDQQDRTAELRDRSSNSSRIA